jgi:hypothetical protein
VNSYKVFLVVVKTGGTLVGGWLVEGWRNADASLTFNL